MAKKSKKTPYQQLGRYRVIEELGRGAMGIVYKAEDPVLDRPLAIKTIFIPTDEGDRKEYEARFNQEARAAGRLAHPGIVTIYDVGREGEMVFMAMELLEGIDLSTRAKEQRFSVQETIEITAQVAEALAFAHQTSWRTAFRPPQARGYQREQASLIATALRAYVWKDPIEHHEPAPVSLQCAHSAGRSGQDHKRHQTTPSFVHRTSFRPDP